MTAADAQARLAAFLSESARSPLRIEAFRILPGGAIQENWLLDISVDKGKWRGRHELVLRHDAPTAVAASHGRAREYRLLEAAHKAGVTVPAPFLVCGDASVLGGPFFIMRRVTGEAAGHRLTKRPADPALAARLGQELARIHAITPDTPAAKSLSFLPLLQEAPSLARIALYRRWLDSLQAPRPALEWGLRRLELTAPAKSEIVLCHRDFRTGNYMVEDGAKGGALTGILDWEFAAWGEPEEDIGWFCARCWRFAAREREAGGIADRQPFYDAYEEATGRRINAARVAWWETMAHVRWAVIGCQQAERYTVGGEQSLELALTAHVVPELELEVLRLTGEVA
ncbi:MAG: phosphotransferase family protein [Rhodospirillales bacterium]